MKICDHILTSWNTSPVYGETPRSSKARPSTTTATHKHYFKRILEMKMAITSFGIVNFFFAGWAAQMTGKLEKQCSWLVMLNIFRKHNIPLFHEFRGDTTSTLSEISVAKLDRNNNALIVTAKIKTSVKGAAIFSWEEPLSTLSFNAPWEIESVYHCTTRIHYLRETYNRLQMPKNKVKLHFLSVPVGKKDTLKNTISLHLFLSLELNFANIDTG